MLVMKMKIDVGFTVAMPLAGYSREQVDKEMTPEAVTKAKNAALAQWTKSIGEAGGEVNSSSIDFEIVDI